MSTTETRPEQIAGEALSAIKSGEYEKASGLFAQYKSVMASPETAALFGNWITEPVNFKPIHEALIDAGVPARSLAIQRGAYTRIRRGFMMVQAMEVITRRIS